MNCKLGIVARSVRASLAGTPSASYPKLKPKEFWSQVPFQTSHERDPGSYEVFWRTMRRVAVIASIKVCENIRRRSTLHTKHLIHCDEGHVRRIKNSKFRRAAAARPVDPPTRSTWRHTTLSRKHAFYPATPATFRHQGGPYCLLPHQTVLELDGADRTPHPMRHISATVGCLYRRAHRAVSKID